MTLRILALLAGLAVAHASVAHAQTPPAAPHAEHDGTGNTMFVTGLTVLVSSWALTGATATTLVALANQRPEITIESWIPVVGPWIMLGDTRGYDDLQLGLTVASAVVQTIATGVMIAGLVLDAQAPPRPAARAGVHVLPTFGASGAGISLSGWF